MAEEDFRDSKTPMWLLLLVTSVFIHHSLCCIECDTRGKEAINKFHTLIKSQVGGDIEAFINIKRFAKIAERQVIEFLEDEVQMLDNYAMTEIVGEYKKSVDIIEETDFKEVQLLHIIGLHFQRLKEKIKDIVQDMNKRRCPNKHGAHSCGLMVQTYTSCKTCAVEKVICAGGPPENQEYFDRCTCLCTNRCFDLKTGHSCSPCTDHRSHMAQTVSCGERNIKVTEDDDLILDCNLEWHARLEDSYKNVFRKHLDIEPKITEDPYLEIKGVQMEDSGQYMCTTILKSDVPVSNIVYHVTVLRGSGRTTEKYQHRPTRPPEFETTTPLPYLPEGFAMYLVGIAITSTLVIVPILICVCILSSRKKEPLEKEPV